MILIFNDIAGSEVLLILAFVLIFFGSKSIPGLAKTLGRTIRQVKDASAEIQQEIRKSGADIKKDLNLTGIIDETAQDIKRPLDQYAQDLDDAVRYQPRKANSHLPDLNTQRPEPKESSREPESNKDVSNSEVAETPQEITKKKD